MKWCSRDRSLFRERYNVEGADSQHRVADKRIPPVKPGSQFSRFRDPSRCPENAVLRAVADGGEIGLGHIRHSMDRFGELRLRCLLNVWATPDVHLAEVRCSQPSPPPGGVYPTGQDTNA